MCRKPLSATLCHFKAALNSSPAKVALHTSYSLGNANSSTNSQGSNSSVKRMISLIGGRKMKYKEEMTEEKYSPPVEDWFFCVSSF